MDKCKAKRILDIVDMQNDFMKPNGALYVQDAEKIIPDSNRFFQSLKTGDFDFALIKYDTHFEEAYDKNPESTQFPPHCIYNSWGWRMSTVMPSNTTTFEMDKNVFDMWAKKPSLKNLSFKTAFNRTAYKNLFKVNVSGKTMSRERFLKYMNIGEGTEVFVMGVASDYCVHDAILGYLKRGCNVTVMQDLVQGIGTDVPGRAATGKIEDVLKLPVFAPYVAAGKLSLSTSDQVLKILEQDKKNECQNKNCRRTTEPKRR